MSTISTKHQFPSNTTLLCTIETINGKKEGKLRRYDITGTLIEQSDYKNDKLHGIQQLFNAKGQLIEQSTYFKGKRHGSRLYYTNNELSDHHLYVNGVLHVKWKSKL